MKSVTAGGVTKVSRYPDFVTTIISRTQTSPAPSARLTARATGQWKLLFCTPSSMSRCVTRIRIIHLLPLYRHRTDVLNRPWETRQAMISFGSTRKPCSPGQGRKDLSGQAMRSGLVQNGTGHQVPNCDRRAFPLITSPASRDVSAHICRPVKKSWQAMCRRRFRWDQYTIGASTRVKSMT